MRDNIKIMGTYVKTTKYLKFDWNWDLFYELPQFGIRGLFAIKVQVKMEYIKLIFENVSDNVEEIDEDEIMESTKEMDKDEDTPPPESSSPPPAALLEPGRTACRPTPSS